jgi:hypothetical protein
MKKCLTALAATLALSVTVIAADLTGVWTMSWEPDFGGNLDAYDCTFMQSGRSLTIDCGGSAMAGKVEGRKVTIRFNTGRDGKMAATLTGELNEAGTTIAGTWHLPAPENREGKFTASKQ